MSDSITVANEPNAPITPVAPPAAPPAAPPTITVTVSGTAQEGQTLTATATSDDANAIIAYQWQNSPDGTTWTDISGANTSTYAPTPGDDGRELRVVAAATDSNGSTLTISDPTLPVAPPPPPTITVTVSGTAEEGQTLTAMATSDDAKATITYQWQNSLDGTTWTDISGANTNTYAPTQGDDGRELRVVAGATDASGSTLAISTPTMPVVPVPPPTVAVTVSGIAQEGQTLTAMATSDDANATLAFQWQNSLDGTTWTNISGANTSTYVPTPGDDGRELRVVVGATDAGGNTTAISTPTAAVPFPNPRIVEPNQSVVTQAGSTTTVEVATGGTNFITTLGNDTVNAGSGLDVVFAAGPTTLVNGGSGQLIFVGGSGGATVHGGTGTSIIYGGLAGGDFSGGTGGNNILVAGVGNTTLRGGGNGDALFGAPTGGNLLKAGPGSEILVEGGGATSVEGGGGTYVAFAGTGPDTYQISDGVGGNDLIVGFKSGIDKLALNGFNTTQALAGATSGDWGTTLNLADGTKVVLFGVHNLGAGDIT